MDVLICSPSVQQAEPIKKLLDDLKIQNSLILGETTSVAFEKKNISNLTFLQGCLKHLFFGRQARSSFSYSLIAYNLSSQKNYFKKPFFWLCSSIGLYLPKLSLSLSRFIELIASRKNINKHNSFRLIIFSGVLSSNLEVSTFLGAKKNAIKIYWPHNWDNSSSKLFVPLDGFDYSFAWGERMQKQMQKSGNLFGKVSIIPNPRLLPLYKLREQMKIKNFERENILLALSQKNNKNLKAYLANIAKQFNNLDRYKLIIRPHPQSLITKSFIQEVESLSERFYVDPHFKEINNSFGDIVPMKEKRFRKDFDNRLFKLLEKTALIMTEGGTITLDAGLLNIPVIGLFINPHQRTARYFPYFDHYSEITTSKWFRAVFTDYKIDEVINSLTSTYKYFGHDDFKSILSFIPESQSIKEDFLTHYMNLANEDPNNSK